MSEANPRSATIGRTLRVAAFVGHTRTEGPHLRAALWVQGCSIGCPGCCNPEFFDPKAGRLRSIATLARALARAKARWSIEGLTVLGGEPLEQIRATTALAQSARDLDLGVIVYTGMTAARAESLPGWASLWQHVDTVVAEPYIAALRLARAQGPRPLGSSNQRFLHATARYADETLWTRPVRVDLSFRGSDVSLCGDPSLSIETSRALRKPTEPR